METDSQMLRKRHLTSVTSIVAGRISTIAQTVLRLLKTSKSIKDLNIKSNTSPRSGFIRLYSYCLATIYSFASQRQS